MTAPLESTLRRARLRLDLLGWWHPGTGRGDGVAADAVVLLDAAALPYLPGRTVKGLLREAVRLGVAAGIRGVDATIEQRLFGTGLLGNATNDRVRRLEAARFQTEPGCLRVHDAVLGATPAEAAVWRAWASSAAGSERVRELVTTLASTAVDAKTGTVQEHSLRTIEVAAPMTLWAPLSVEGEAPVPWEAISDAVTLFLRAVGSHRTRGLGRCVAQILRENA